MQAACWFPLCKRWFDPVTKEQLECAFEGIGRQVGELVRCMVQAEIATQTQRIEQLQALLLGQACQPSDSAATEGEPPAS
jgi:hypothetical protein